MQNETKQKKSLLLLKGFQVIGKTIFTAFKTLFLLLLVALIMWVNYTVDISGYYHSNEYEKLVAQRLLEGENIVDYDSLNERTINQYYAEALKGKRLEALALGSSRVKQLSADILGTNSFFNAGMSAADFYDILGTYYQFEKAAALPENLIIELDPWLLNGDDSWGYRSDKELYNEFLSVSLGIDTGYVEEKVDPLEKWKPLLDLAYFQANTQKYISEGITKTDEPEIINENLYEQDFAILRNDGSVIYPEGFRNTPAEIVEDNARAEAGTMHGIDNFITLDSNRREIFSKFIEHAQDSGVNVIFLLTPYSLLPYIYAYENIEKCTGFFESEKWLVNYARKNNIPMYGSYNPMRAGYFYEDFFDGIHMRPEALDEMLPSLDEILQAQEKHEAYSPFILKNKAVLYATAEELVKMRNQIPEKQSLMQGPDTTIDGSSAYVVKRYSGTPGSSTLLAQYAVTQDNGYLYRLDTSKNMWVYDAWF